MMGFDSICASLLMKMGDIALQKNQVINTLSAENISLTVMAQIREHTLEYVIPVLGFSCEIR